MRLSWSVAILALATSVASFAHFARAQVGVQSTAGAGTAPDTPLFAVEIKLGPKWEPAKPPQEQAHFREHSANLKQLRDEGFLLLGARYSDKGLVVLAAPSIEAARAVLERDPSIQAGVFAYEVHPMSVFYSGTVTARQRR